MPETLSLVPFSKLDLLSPFSFCTSLVHVHVDNANLKIVFYVTVEFTGLCIRVAKKRNDAPRKTLINKFYMAIVFPNLCNFNFLSLGSKLINKN